MKGKGMNSAMKKFGRGVAKAKNQGAKYAAGGAVKMPMAKDMGSMAGMGMDGSGFGSGTARGGKSKGKKFRGTF